jgi:hypothetical protein
MPSSAVQTFTDPDEYAAAIRASKAEVTVTGRGQFAAKLTGIRLHRLWTQRFLEYLPRTLHSAIASGRAIVSFRTQPGPGLFWSGTELQPSNIIRHVEGESAFQRSSGSAGFASVSLPVEEIVSVGEAIAGLDLTPPKAPLILVPAPSAMAKLRRLHAAAAGSAEKTPEIFASPSAAHGLDQR